MFVDSIQLGENSLITKKVINAAKRGSVFPGSPGSDDVFELTTLFNGKRKGIYRYSAEESAWILESPDSSFVPYDISGYVSGKVESSAVLTSLIAVRDYKISADFYGCLAVAGVASIAGTTLKIVKVKRDGIVQDLGDLIFNAGVTHGSFVSATSQDIKVRLGEIFQLRASA